MFADRTLVKRVTAYLKEKRVEAGLTQKAVAEEFGYSSGQFISNWERGLVMPPLATVRQLAQLYKIDLKEVADVISGETDRVIRQELFDKNN